MTLETERIAIEGRFQTLWVEGSPSVAITPVGYSSQPFTPTASSVRLTIMDGMAEAQSIGSPGTNLVRNVGIIIIQIFVAGGAGEATMRPLAETAQGIFRNAVFGGIRCRVPYISGTTEDPPFLVWNIVAPFVRDELNG